MILKIYFIGATLCIVWFLFAAILTFERSVYDNQTEEGKKSIDYMIETLESISPENPQMAYMVISLIITIIWPVSVPYLWYKMKFK
jgi:hypothetical protein